MRFGLVIVFTEHIQIVTTSISGTVSNSHTHCSSPQRVLCLRSYLCLHQLLRSDVQTMFSSSMLMFLPTGDCCCSNYMTLRLATISHRRCQDSFPMRAGSHYIASAWTTQGTLLPKHHLVFHHDVTAVAAAVVCMCVRACMLWPLPSIDYGVAAYFTAVSKQWIYVPQYEWHEGIVVWKVQSHHLMGCALNGMHYLTMFRTCHVQCR
jgi:hypothetical protein